ELAGFANEHTGRRRGRDQREDPRRRSEGGAEVPFGIEADRTTDGLASEETHRRLEVRRRVDRLSGPGPPQPAGCGTAQSGTRLDGFDFEAAFKRPVKVMNDAAMQALGSYRTGKMLFLGLGTGLGSTLILDGIVGPMELGHLPYKKGTYEDYVG